MIRDFTRTMFESWYPDPKPTSKPPIENALAPGGAFNVGSHTGAGAIKSREIFRENVKPVPEKPAPKAEDFGGYRAQVLSFNTNPKVQTNAF
jgi:hypothetical protein